jgi:hypothetical protein
MSETEIQGTRIPLSKKEFWKGLNMLASCLILLENICNSTEIPIEKIY